MDAGSLPTQHQSRGSAGGGGIKARGRHQLVEEAAAGHCIVEGSEPVLQPQDVARMVLFLASDDGAMCTAHEFKVDAGWL